LNHKDEEGWNVLCFLCNQPSPKNNRVEILRLLINRGVDLDWKNKENKNILHFYCRHYKGENFIDIVNVFMESGVKVVSEGEDARRLINNPKYPNRPNADEIIKLMNKNC
jgi:ankyrin repeat protein